MLYFFYFHNLLIKVIKSLYLFRTIDYLLLIWYILVKLKYVFIYLVCYLILERWCNLMTKFNAPMLLPVLFVFGIIVFTIPNANLSFIQLFQPGAQDELLLPDTHQNNKKEISSLNTVVAQNKVCNNNAISHISC